MGGLCRRPTAAATPLRRNAGPRRQARRTGAKCSAAAQLYRRFTVHKTGALRSSAPLAAVLAHCHTPMESPNSEPSSGDSPAVQPVHPVSSPPPRPPWYRRRIWLGSLIALLLLLVLGGGAWYLINRKSSPAGGPGFGGATVTVGHAAAREIELPVTIEALGTVTPLATITLKAQVGGVLSRRAASASATKPSWKRARALQRYRTLLEQDSIARQDVDTQAALVKQLKARSPPTRRPKASPSSTSATPRCARRSPAASACARRHRQPGEQRRRERHRRDHPDVADRRRIRRAAGPVPALQERINANAACRRSRWTAPARATWRPAASSRSTTRSTPRPAPCAPRPASQRRRQAVPEPVREHPPAGEHIKNAVTVPVTALRHGANGDFVYVLNPQTRRSRCAT
jgi:hypothetical protein